MVLAQNYTYGSLEQNRESRNKPTCSKSVNLQIRKQKHTMGKRQRDAGVTENRYKRNAIRKFSHMMYHNKLKIG